MERHGFVGTVSRATVKAVVGYLLSYYGTVRTDGATHSMDTSYRLVQTRAVLLQQSTSTGSYEGTTVEFKAINSTIEGVRMYSTYRSVCVCVCVCLDPKNKHTGAIAVV